jgi:hypothetical protein
MKGVSRKASCIEFYQNPRTVFYLNQAILRFSMALKQNFLTSVSPPYSTPVFLDRRAAARYRALASIIPGRENLSFYFSKHFS